jgi:hypothetical protein
MPNHRQRLVVRIFHLFEGEAEGPLAIAIMSLTVFVVIIVALNR